jgi:tyrosinase
MTLAWALLRGAGAQYSSYDYGPLGKTLLARQTTPSPIVTTGVHTGTGVNGSLPLRIEVRELEQNQNLWTLYILGLDFMMRNTSEADMLSWYQISGT